MIGLRINNGGTCHFDHPNKNGYRMNNLKHVRQYAMGIAQTLQKLQYIQTIVLVK